MTIREAIDTIDHQKPNEYTLEEKIAWLRQLDGIVVTEVFIESVSTVRYTIQNENRPLLIPPPYDMAYIYWLDSKIDYANAEIGKFNNSNAMFEAEFQKFVKWYKREHLPDPVRFTYY